MTDTPTALEAAVRRECRGQTCTYPACPSDCGGLTYYGGERFPKALFERGWKAALLAMAERPEEGAAYYAALIMIKNIWERERDLQVGAARTHRASAVHARSLMAGTEKEKT